MSTHKWIDKICCVILVLCLVLTVLFMNAKSFGVAEDSRVKGYETRLFDTSTVHTIDIVMDDWDSFLETCTNEEYALRSVVIDNEAYKDVAIRAKGNTSLTQVDSYGNDRYSFKIEFDHYDSTKSYYGLDKLSLNNIIQDNTYMKDFLTYQMMQHIGADAPLCSYVNITVNGENWGLYLAVESIEEAFLERNYGSDYGELYKPDSTGMGGGRGNGGKFDLDDWTAQQNQENHAIPEGITAPSISGSSDAGGNNQTQQNGIQPPNGEPPADGEMPRMPNREGPAGNAFPGGGMGSDDVKLIYSDDDYDSYSNIFDNAKTDITDADKDRLIASLKQLNSNENMDEVVNIDEVIRYFVVHNFVCNFDSYTGSMIHNYYLYEEDGQLSMIPWDYNLAFGGFQDVKDAATLVNYPIDSPVSSGTVDSRPMLAWIFSSEEYTALYHKYFANFFASFFDSGYFSELIDTTQAMIAPFVEQDATKFCTYEQFQTGVDTLKEFCLLRAESVRGQLDGTIPSTSDGQAQDSSSLIDASGLSISNMGSMGSGRGGGNNKPSFQNNNSSDSLQNQPPSNPEQPTLPDGGQPSEFPQRRDNGMKSAPKTEEGEPANTQMISTDSRISISLSCFVLIAAVLVAMQYKKRS